MDGRYDADTAQLKAWVKRGRSKELGMKVEGNRELKAYVIHRLTERRSPDEIAGRMKKEGQPFYASKTAIYAWLYSVWGQAYCQYLCSRRYRKRKRRGEKKKRVMIPERVSIYQRPLGASRRSRYGHWEGDTIVAPRRAGNTEAVAMIVERKSLLIVACRIPSLSPAMMTGAIRTMMVSLRSFSITLDNGIENKGHRDWEVPAFFADPHSPEQKPLVESSIGLLRRWYFPKGTDWGGVKTEKLHEAVEFLNHKYRKSLGYRSAYEVATAHGILKNISREEVAFRG